MKDKKKDAPKQVATQGESGSDPRGRGQNQNAYQQQRYEGQIDPYINTAMGGYGRAADQAFADYGGIMDQYRDMMGPEGYGEFAETGGFSEADKAAMRARGISPIRAAYANAEREVERQRSLQGGYSPNATATLAKMAREQGQSAADATTNVEAALAERVQAGRLAGLAGQMNAIQGQSGLYGTSPGMASMFGNQALGGINSSGDFGLGTTRNEIATQNLPGAFQNTTSKVRDIAGAIAPWASIIEDFINKKPKAPTTTTPSGAMSDNVFVNNAPTGSNTNVVRNGPFGSPTFIPAPTNRRTSIFGVPSGSPFAR